MKGHSDDCFIIYQQISISTPKSIIKKESWAKKKNQKEKSERKVGKRKFNQRKRTKKKEPKKIFKFFFKKLSIKESGAKKIAPLISSFLSLSLSNEYNKSF